MPRLLLGPFLLVFATHLSAQELTLVRYVESTMRKVSFIEVVHDTGETETLELEGWGGMTTTPGSLAEAMRRNQRTLMDLMVRLRSKGLHLTHMSSTGETMMSTLLIFERREGADH